jgi:hypothetical protein
MAEPVFVIHGVNVKRDEEAYAGEVRQLNRAVGTQWRFIPIYWADLGGNDKFIEATIPRQKAEVTAEALLAGSLGAKTTVRADTAADIAADSAAARAAVNSPVRTTDPLRAQVRDEWEQTEVLRLIRDADLASEIGSAIGEAIAAGDGGSMMVRGAETRSIVSSVVHAFDKVVKAIVSRWLARLNEMLRLEFGPTLARFLGDIFVHRATPTEIDHRLLKALKAEGLGTKEKPATILAHSYGGVISFMLTTRKNDPIYVRKMVTFGSQSSLFHVIQPIGLLQPFLGTPVALPPTIGSWLNVWEPLDPLAFLAASIFRLNGGGAPEDRQMKHDASGSLWTHSSYWTDKRFAKWVAEFLST